MDRQDIIDMIAKVYGVAWTSEAQLKDLERFAALVASAEREAWEHRYARLQSLMDVRETQPNKPCCLAEREACAKVCEDAPEPDGTDLAERIRARGNVATNDTSQERVDKTSVNVHEPVAWRAWVSKFPQGTGSDWVYVTKPIMKDRIHNQPIYTTPPQRKPLTDEEIILIVAECASSHQHTDIHFARAIERAHGIKELV